MNTHVQRHCRILVLVATDAFLLWFARPAPAMVALVLGHPSGAIASLGADAVVAVCARGALWLAAIWAALGLLALLGGGLPGTIGRTCHLLAVTVVPAEMRRLAVGALGLGLLAGPATSAMASAPAAVPPPAAHATLTGASGPPGTPSLAVPAPPWPGTPTRTGHGRSHDAPPPFPTGPRSRHEPASRRAPHDTAQPADETVKVRSDDSLWVIAQRRLGPHTTVPDIAAYWPRVYAANRGVIGRDPDLVVPGQVLHLPVPDRPR